jgi:hypothetical protein
MICMSWLKLYVPSYIGNRLNVANNSSVMWHNHWSMVCVLLPVFSPFSPLAQYL